MADFLLELLSEEIPARMQAKAEADLARLFTEQLTAAGLAAEAIETYSTPRRLALIARGLPTETAAVSEEIKGPRSSAPPQALDGFLRKTGLSREQLVERDGVLFAVIDKPGRSTATVLAEAVPAAVPAFPWPKSMRWGAASFASDSRQMIECSGRTQRSEPAPQRIDLGQGKLRMAASRTSATISDAGRPGFSTVANQT